MRWKLKAAAAVYLLLLLCTACGSEQEAESGSVYDIYYVNNEETNTLTRQYVSETTDSSKLLQELLGQLGTLPPKLDYKAPLADGFKLLGYTLENGQLTMNFDDKYKSMDITKEVLTRAAIVRTVTQIPEISLVSFTVQGEMLADSSGMAIGTMNADSFIENAGDEINAYEKVNLKLYYANEDGTGLVEENRRNVVYNSNISLEKLIVERLIDGPPYEGVYPTIPANTRLVSVSVRDGICYVNLDAGFLETGYNVTESIPIYSIVNSLIRNTDAQKVQISIDGETNRIFRESISFDTIFERNEELVE